jgi:hypothetical protein
MPSPHRPSTLLAVSLVFAGLGGSPLTRAQGTPSTPPAAGEETVIPGVVLTRPGGGFLGVETEGVTMRVTFYDEKQAKQATDVIRITARWSDTQPRLTVLLPASPESFVSPGVLRRPFNYLVYLALIGPDEQVVETHSLRLR